MAIEIVNSYGPGPGRKYCIYSEAPQISVGDVQQSGSLRIASYVVGPIEYGGRKEFSYRARYFGFIGKISEVGGTRIVRSEMERDVKVGAIDNWTGFNASLPDGVLTIQCSSQLDSPQGAFIIRCDSNPAPHDVSVVVGLAQLFDGKLVPVAAVPYVDGITYTIKPRPMYIVQADMIPGQVIPQNIVLSGQAAPHPEVRCRFTEENNGRFRIDVTGQGSGYVAPLPPPTRSFSYVHLKVSPGSPTKPLGRDVVDVNEASDWGLLQETEFVRDILQDLCILRGRVVEARSVDDQNLSATHGCCVAGRPLRFRIDAITDWNI
jgi:hypothetical protein